MTLRGGGPRRGTALSKLGIIEDGAVLLRDGLIIAADTRARIESRKDARQAEKIDVGGRVILPGFVDSHTHLVHAASRAEEYELKIQGVSYEEIARKGGGILNSVKRLRAATSDALKRRALGALQEFASFGTTTVEAKSGYGSGRCERTQDSAVAPRAKPGAAAGNCFDISGRACRSRRISRQT